MEASKTGMSWYGNPWLELADLYMRAGRFAEALRELALPKTEEEEQLFRRLYLALLVYLFPRMPE